VKVHEPLNHLNLNGATNRQLLILSGDVELNPGPNGKLIFGTYNVSGCKEYNKLKILTAWLFNQAKSDRFVFSLQETHIGSKESSLVRMLWRSGVIISPSINNARGVLTFYNSSLFENIILESGSSDGRSTWLIGSTGSQVEMFISIYSPNSGKNAEFYTAFFKKVNNLAVQYSVDNIFISGDFNLEIWPDKNNLRKISKYEDKLAKLIRFELDSLGLNNLFDKCKDRHTWNRNKKFSTLDYVIGPKQIADSKPFNHLKWGVDKSDHAAIYVDIRYELDKGKGMFRPNLAFLDSPELRQSFESELFLELMATPSSWDPHMKLEFTKVMIRTKVGEFSLKFKKSNDDRHNNCMAELDRLKNLKEKLVNVPSHPLNSIITLEDVDKDIDSIEAQLDKILIERTKMLANKSRIKWLEYGEKSNKYFMNINKSFQNKSYFKSMFRNNQEVFSIDEKLDVVHKFYEDLYTKHEVQDPTEFLSKINVREINDDKNILSEPITKEELLAVLKKCGDTASGPDGISYRLIKVCWSFYANTLIDSWQYALEKGCLTQSHREAVVCLLPKKGKDPRHVGNLRPISLSNCDIKIITKALAKRMNFILGQSLNPHQTAYLPGRIIHDNLRTIDIIRNYCTQKNINGFLVSLDAKKAFDSVDHRFIEKVLEKFGCKVDFIKIFKLLYHRLESRVLLNGFLTKEFKLGRSVKQGDALSCSLFIMCMEIIINYIEYDMRINRIHINNCHVPKVLAFADDVAILTNDSTSVKSAISLYNEFSKYSGLCLNIDKTEIFCLDTTKHPCDIIIDENTCIQSTKSIVICGRAYSCSLDEEYNLNVNNKIDKLEQALESWRKRSLSIFGRNLILKTFGLSQTIYSMQNSFFDIHSLKRIERICFNFLWNKKVNKTKAFERISRSKLKLPLSEGGISAPDIVSLNQALKYIQLIRSTEEPVKHVIKDLQIHVLGYRPDRIFQDSMKSSDFLETAYEASRNLGGILIKEITEDDAESRLHTNYYNLIASENTINLLNFFQVSPIVKQQAHLLQAKLGIRTYGQLINEYKYPSTDKFNMQVKNLVNSMKVISTKFLARKMISYGLDFRDGFFLKTNSLTKSCLFTTKLVKNRLLHGDKIDNPLSEFMRIKKITHPKEKEVEFFDLHDVILSNEKLASMKLIDSANCPICDVIQSSRHIFNECYNAKLARAVIDSFDPFGMNPSVRINVESLIKKTLLSHKNDKLNSDFLRLILHNRIQDLMNIQNSKRTRKNLKEINSYTLRC